MAWLDSHNGNPLVALPGVINGTVNAIAIQSDGGIVIGGAFTNVNNVTRNRIARFDSNGNLDTAFAPLTGAVPGVVRAIAIQADGKILVGGDTSNRLTRLEADGTQDVAFAPAPNNNVKAIAIQSDNKIIVGGDFTNIAATVTTSLARLNTDGTFDATFVPSGAGSGISTGVLALAIDGVGNVLGGGSATTNGFRFQRTYVTAGIGVIRSIFRLNQISGQPNTWVTNTASGTGYSQLFDVATSCAPDGIGLKVDVDINGVNNGNINDVRVAEGDGTKYGSGFTGTSTVTILAGGNDSLMSATYGVDGIDQSFDAGTAGGTNTVNAIAIQTDGKILIGGTFTTVRGSTANRIARLNAIDGSLDNTFSGSFTQTVNAIKIRSDGKILVGANSGASCLLNADGTVNLQFSSTIFSQFAGTFSGSVIAVAIQSDNKMLIGGTIANPFVSSTSLNFVRLDTSGVMDLTFNPGAGVASVAGLQGNAAGVTINNGVEGLFNGGFDSDFTLDPAVGFTITFWFNRATTGSNSNSTPFRVIGLANAWSLHTTFATTSPTLSLTFNDGQGNSKTVGHSPTNSAWHFVRIWLDPNDRRIYLEVDRNNLAALGTFPNAITAAGLLCLYHSVSGANFTMDELAVYRGVLTDDQADVLYNAGAPPAYPNVPGA